MPKNNNANTNNNTNAQTQNTQAANQRAEANNAQINKQTYDAIDSLFQQLQNTTKQIQASTVSAQTQNSINNFIKAKESNLKTLSTQSNSTYKTGASLLLGFKAQQGNINRENIDKLKKECENIRNQLKRDLKIG